MGISRDEALAHAEAMVAATDLPVSGDFEGGFGDSPDVVAETVRLGAEAGLSGLSIEDTIPVAGAPSYAFDLAVERVRAGVAAARALGRDFVFCARADGVMNGLLRSSRGIRRLQAFEAAGADLLYLPVPPGKRGTGPWSGRRHNPGQCAGSGALARGDGGMSWRQGQFGVSLPAARLRG